MRFRSKCIYLRDGRIYIQYTILKSNILSWGTAVASSIAFAVESMQILIVSNIIWFGFTYILLGE